MVTAAEGNFYSNDRRARPRHTPESWRRVALDVDIAESAAIASLAETVPGRRRLRPRARSRSTPRPSPPMTTISRACIRCGSSRSARHVPRRAGSQNPPPRHALKRGPKPKSDQRHTAGKFSAPSPQCLSAPSPQCHNARLPQQTLVGSRGYGDPSTPCRCYAISLSAAIRASPGLSCGLTCNCAPGRSKRYRAPVTGPTTVSAVLPKYSNRGPR